jgi:hypothetical protein
MHDEQLIALIRGAFADVTLGEGVGLREGMAMDGYKSDAEQAIERQADEKHDWPRIPDEDLKRYSCALCYMDEEGMRFHIPAFMLADIKRSTRVCLFHLTSLDEYTLSQFGLLTAAQRGAVIAYLRWSREQYDNYPDRDAIDRALREYWELPAHDFASRFLRE